MLRLTLILTLTATPLFAINVIEPKRSPGETLYPSAEAAIASQQWQQREGLFNTGSGSQRQHTKIRSCEIDLDRPVVLGQRSVVVGAHYSRPLDALHRKLRHRFRFKPTGTTLSFSDQDNS